MSEYRRRLESEYHALVRRRIGLRGFLEAVSKGWQSGGTEHTLDMVKQAKLELRASEFRYGELRHLLGMPEPMGAIKIPPAEVSRAQTAAIRAGTARRGAISLTSPSRRVPNYICKVMVAGK
jgi:hypothetical protein